MGQCGFTDPRDILYQHMRPREEGRYRRFDCLGFPLYNTAYIYFEASYLACELGRFQTGIPLRGAAASLIFFTAAARAGVVSPHLFIVSLNGPFAVFFRSEERRVGKECRSR